LHNPSFGVVARLCGRHAGTVTAADQLDDDLAEAAAHLGSVLVEVITDAESL